MVLKERISNIVMGIGRVGLSFTIAFLCLIADRSAAAADISLETQDDLDFIFISGEIEDSDVAHFQRLAVSSDNAAIVLESPGGALDPALKIGEIIRLKGFYTYVPNNTTCTSSCALIWVAGQTRYIASSARVGFHASYVLSDGGPIEKGVGNARVGRYLTLLNLPERAVVFATSAAPDEIMWINTANTSESGIAFEVFDLDSEADTVADNPAPRATTASRLVKEFSWSEGAWTVMSFTDRSGCFVVAEFDSEGSESNKSSLSAGIDLDGKSYISFSNERFRAIRDKEDYEIKIVFKTGETLDEGWGTRTFSGLVHSDGEKSVSTSLDWADLKEDLANEETVAFFMDGEVIDYFPLAGSKNAMRQIDRCMSNTGSVRGDPFAN